MSKVVNPICPDCSNQCPCTLLETIGKTCTDVRNVIEDGEFAAMQFNTDCGVDLINVQDRIRTIIEENPQTIPIGNDLNGYAGDGSSLIFDNVNKVLYYDQDLIRRKFPKQVLARVTIDFALPGFPSTIELISTQNVPESDIELNVSTVRKDVTQRHWNTLNGQLFTNVFRYFNITIGGNGWSSLYPTSMNIIQNEIYISPPQYDTWEVNSVMKTIAMDSRDTSGNRIGLENSWDLVVIKQSRYIENGYFIFDKEWLNPQTNPIQYFVKVIDPFALSFYPFFTGFNVPNINNLINAGVVELTGKYRFEVLFQQRY